MRKKKNRATRVSARFRGRKPLRVAFSEKELFMECCVMGAEDLKIRFSILTQVTNVMQNMT